MRYQKRSIGTRTPRSVFYRYMIMHFLLHQLARSIDYHHHLSVGNTPTYTSVASTGVHERKYPSACGARANTCSPGNAWRCLAQSDGAQG